LSNEFVVIFVKTSLPRSKRLCKENIYIEYGTSSFSGSRSPKTFKRKIVIRDELRGYFQIKEGFAGLKFIEWTSWNSCKFKMPGKEFKLLNIEKDTIEIE
jgi:hypothetical protein